MTSVLGGTLPPWMGEDGPEVGCASADPEEFFPPGYGMEWRREVDGAKARCLACPLLDACMSWAIPQTDLEGIWGATTPRERRRIRTQQRKKTA
jgi:WhiB family redox-sensing transcriptional regulator